MAYYSSSRYRAAYSKKGSKSRARKSYASKKTASYKKSGYSKAGGGSKHLIRKVVKEMLRGPAKKIQLRGVPDEVPFFSRSPWGGNCYLRIPVTQAIPGQGGAQVGPDDHWRESNKIIVKGVSLRAKIDFSTRTEVVAVCYPDKLQNQKISLNEYQRLSFNIQ